MSAGNEEQLEMLDYAIDMLSAELPLIEQEYGWTPALQEDIRGRLQAARDSISAGEAAPSLTLATDLDTAGINEGSLREFCTMIEGALAG